MEPSDLYFQLFISVGLAVGASFFCSISEAAFYSIPTGYVERLKEEGKKSGIYLSQIREQMGDYIASILILNTLANTIGVYKAGSVSLELFHENPTILSLFPIVMTVVILVFAELIPKTMGVQYNRKVAPILATPFVYITKLFKLFGLIWLAKATTRMFDNNDDTTAEYSSEELESIAKLSAEEGSIDSSQRDLIQQILSLSETTIKKVLTPRPVMNSLDINLTIGEIFQKKFDLPHSRIPVYEHNTENILGIVLKNEIYEAAVEGKTDLKLRNIKRTVDFTPESVKLDTLLKKFLGKGLHITMVVDEYGGIAGLVTLEDLLEEVIGQEIMDETDQVPDLQEQARHQSKAFIELKRQEAE